ncbi:DUF3604 domain-containing protein, partial [Methylogaea oryzae]|uniref:DUF3604 domain-containing protein n=1 Tax=Methylogaea oryzae TaxID=1295382 RepID=UPI001C3F2E6A
GGLTGVLAPELTRSSIAAALRARHTWATTGERLVGLISVGDQVQGDAFEHDGPTRLDYRFLGEGGWDSLSAWDHTGCFWERDFQKEGGYSERRFRVRWGGARVRDRYRWAEWRGTVTLRNAVIHGYAAQGFEHREENAWREGATVIGFRSDTYGDADALEIDASGLEGATLVIEGRIDGYARWGIRWPATRSSIAPSSAGKSTGANCWKRAACAANWVAPSCSWLWSGSATRRCRERCPAAWWWTRSTVRTASAPSTCWHGRRTMRKCGRRRCLSVFGSACRGIAGRRC